MLVLTGFPVNSAASARSVETLVTRGALTAVRVKLVKRFRLLAWLLPLVFAAAPALADKLDYYAWQRGSHDSIVCAKSEKTHGSLGDCERPGPKDLTELVCDPKFAPGSGIKKEKLSPAWIAACKKYEDSGRHAIVVGRATLYFAWQPGAHGIECKQVAKGFGTPGKCIYPGPKNYKELICTEQFFKYSGEKVDDDVFCKRHPWKPPVRTAEDEDDGGGDETAPASASANGGGEDVMPNPAQDRGDSGVSSDFN